MTGGGGADKIPVCRDCGTKGIKGKNGAEGVKKD